MAVELEITTSEKDDIWTMGDAPSPFAIEIAEIFGLRPGDVVRNNLDVDLSDNCRSLEDDGVYLGDEDAVQRWFAKNPTHKDYPRYVDALVDAALDKILRKHFKRV